MTHPQRHVRVFLLAEYLPPMYGLRRGKLGCMKAEIRGVKAIAIQDEYAVWNVFSAATSAPRRGR